MVIRDGTGAVPYDDMLSGFCRGGAPVPARLYDKITPCKN